MDPQNVNPANPTSSSTNTPPIVGGSLPPLPNQNPTFSPPAPVVPPVTPQPSPIPKIDLSQPVTMPTAPTNSFPTMPIAPQTPLSAPAMPTAPAAAQQVNVFPPQQPVAPPLKPSTAPYKEQPKPKSSGGGGFMGTLIVFILSLLIGTIVGAIGWYMYGTQVLEAAGITVADNTQVTPTPTPTPVVTTVPETCVDGATDCENWSAYAANACPVNMKLPGSYYITAGSQKETFAWVVKESTRREEIGYTGGRVELTVSQAIESGLFPLIEIDCYKKGSVITSLDDATSVVIAGLKEAKRTATVNTKSEVVALGTTVQPTKFQIKEFEANVATETRFLNGAVTYKGEYAFFMKISSAEGLFSNYQFPTDLTITGLPNTYWIKDQYAIFQNIRLR